MVMLPMTCGFRVYILRAHQVHLFPQGISSWSEYLTDHAHTDAVFFKSQLTYWKALDNELMSFKSLATPSLELLAMISHLTCW